MVNKTTILENTPSNLKINQQLPNLELAPEIIESILLPLELFSLKTILFQNRPVTTYEIHNRITTVIYDNHRAEFGKPEYHFIRTGEPAPKPMEANDMRIELKAHKIKYPSYEKINSTLETLENWGILTRRYEGKGNAKYFWILQPGFNIEMRKKIMEYLKGRPEIISW